MHNNLKIIIKIYNTIFTYRLPCSFHPFYRIGIISLGSTKLENLSMIQQKQGQFQNCCFSTTITTLEFISNFMKCYASSLKVLYSLIGPGKENSIHEYIIFAAPKFVCRNAISPLIMYSVKKWYHR